jgi:hypothetical protein
MGKKSDTRLDNVMMLALGITILLMGVGTRDLMRDANITKKGIKFLVFPTPIRLGSNNLAIKPSLNKALKHLRFGRWESQYTFIYITQETIDVTTELHHSRVLSNQNSTCSLISTRIRFLIYRIWFRLHAIVDY